MRESLSKNSSNTIFEDFGDELDIKVDGNMWQGLARALLMKSYGLISHSYSFKKIINEDDVADIVNEFERRISEDSIIHLKEMNEVYKTLTDKYTIKILKGNAIVISF